MMFALAAVSCIHQNPGLPRAKPPTRGRHANLPQSLELSIFKPHRHSCAVLIHSFVFTTLTCAMFRVQQMHAGPEIFGAPQ